MNSPDVSLLATPWHKSSYSNGTGDNCVEHAVLLNAQQAVRDSKDISRGAFMVSPKAWQQFVNLAKATPTV